MANRAGHPGAAHRTPRRRSRGAVHRHPPRPACSSPGSTPAASCSLPGACAQRGRWLRGRPAPASAPAASARPPGRKRRCGSSPHPRPTRWRRRPRCRRTGRHR
ncbi:hypothetical protein G6F32_016889 [Rhizopus arrhizus]|nr:hypothetical protein G6F32_016889 [Rhizopus arrhizus]